MKICINLLEENKNLGPWIFAKRLARELEQQGIKIVNRSEKHDILLAVIKDDYITESKKKGAKVVQRLDGIYYIGKDYANKNKNIQETFEEANAVIYQSKFSRDWIEKWFGEKSNFFVIPNGADPNKFNKKSSDSDKKFFLCSAKWRPMKRLDSIVKGFLSAKIPNAELHILGKVDNPLIDEKIKYFGEINSKNICKFYNNSNFFVHLAYADNCPNSVVEALVGGLPVICTSSGGTKELVKDSGEIISEDDFEFKPMDFLDIPKISKENVGASLISCLNNEKNYSFPRTDLYINNIAKKYKRAFQEVLDIY